MYLSGKKGLSGDLGAREVLIGELRAAAEPLRESCAAEVRERVDAAVNEAVQAWEDTRAELDALCTRYQRACSLWQQYRDSSAAVKAWVDTQMNSVVNLPPEEAAKQVKVGRSRQGEGKRGREIGGPSPSSKVERRVLSFQRAKCRAIPADLFAICISPGPEMKSRIMEEYARERERERTR